MRSCGRHDSTLCHCSQRSTCAEVRSQASHEYLTQASGWSAGRARDGPARAINNGDCWFPFGHTEKCSVYSLHRFRGIIHLRRDKPQLCRLLSQNLQHWTKWIHSIAEKHFKADMNFYSRFCDQRSGAQFFLVFSKIFKRAKELFFPWPLRKIG